MGDVIPTTQIGTLLGTDGALDVHSMKVLYRVYHDARSNAGFSYIKNGEASTSTWQ